MSGSLACFHFAHSNNMTHIAINGPKREALETQQRFANAVTCLGEDMDLIACCSRKQKLSCTVI